MQTVGIRTMLAVPMVVRGRTLGALTFGWQSRSLPDRDRIAAGRADRAPRRPRARQQLALPGGARRARAARRADAPAAARRDHRRDVVAQAAVHEPARAGAARDGRVRALDRRPARGAHPPRPRRRVDVRRRDRRDPRRRHARPRLAQRRAGARRRRRDRRRRGHALRPDRAPPARGGARVPGRGQRRAHRDARPAAHARPSSSSSRCRDWPTGARSTCSTTARSAPWASRTPIRTRRGWRGACTRGGPCGSRRRAASRPRSAPGARS